MLLKRDEFRDAVFARDNHKCIFCDRPAKDAHHIIERRLFPDGGYYLDNGASVCAEHHIMCETTDISVEEIRERINAKPVLPPHLYRDQRYDKWGNPILPNGQRLRGELFYDVSVQKILKDKLHNFTHWVKYPRTYHLSWSEGMNPDDRMMYDLTPFIGEQVVVTVKMDGENTTMYRDHIHARSVQSRHHESQDWVKNFWSSIRYEIPEGWRICGENLYAKHSILYTNLPSYFLGFSVWNDKNVCLSWKETLEWFELLGITPVKVLYEGEFETDKVVALWRPYYWNVMEGYILRTAGEISYGDFKKKVGKFVRAGHVQTVQHWRYGQQLERNWLREDGN